MVNDFYRSRYYWPVLLAGVMVTGLMLINDAISMILIAIVITLLLQPAVRFLADSGIPRVLSVLLVVSGIAVIFGVGMIHMAVIIPELVKTTQMLPDIINQSIQLVSRWLSPVGLSSESMTFFTLIDNLPLKAILSGVASFFSGMLGATLKLFLLVFFMLYEYPLAVSWCARMSRISPGSRKTVERCIHRIVLYFGIRTLMGIIGGGIVWGTLSFYHLNYAFEWAVLAFLLNYVPIVGAFISTVPPLVQCFIFSGVGDALAILLIFTVATILMGCLVEPLLVGRQLAIPLTVQMLSLILWPVLFGTTGVLLAIPLTSVLMSIFSIWKSGRF